MSIRPDYGGTTATSHPRANQPSAQGGSGSHGDAPEEAKRQAGAVAQDAGEHAGQVTESAKRHAGQVTHTAQQQATGVVEEAKDRAGGLAERAAQQAKDEVGQQRDRAAKSLRALGDELGSMADSSTHSGPATSLARQAAERTHAFAGYVEGHEPGEMLDDLRGIARRKPGAFLLGAALAGVVAGRLTRGVKENKSEQSGRGESTSRPRGAGAPEIDLREQSPTVTGAAPTATHPTAGAPADTLAGRPGYNASGPGTGSEGVR